MLHTCVLAAAASASASASFGRPTMASEDRQMRDSEREPAREPTPGLDSWSFLDGEHRREQRKALSAVAVDAGGSLRFLQGLEAAQQQHLEELTARQTREPAAPGWLSSFTQTLGLSKDDDLPDGEAADVAENFATGAERNGGAPNDHWENCADTQVGGSVGSTATKEGTYGSCACYSGEVRFGSLSQGIWTQPVEMGENADVQCSVDGFQKLRVNMPTHSGAERPRQCQCIERELRIEAIACTPNSDAGCATKPRGMTSLLQAQRREGSGRYADAMSDVANDSDEGKNGFLYPNVQADVCMWVPQAESLEKGAAGGLLEKPSLAQTGAAYEDGEAHSMNQHLILKELATEIELEACDSESPSQVWTFLQSTGQIRHAGTGKCMGVYFDHKSGTGEPLLKAHDCNQNAETQYLVQRWELDGYTGANFESGRGVIRLAYGAHSDHPLCLDAISTDKLDLRTCTPEATKWSLISDDGPHKYKKCSPQSAEEGMCACAGEIRFGDGEGGQFTDGVAVPNMADFAAEVQCDLGLLRQIAIRDPVFVEDSKDPKARTCQCRGAKAGGPESEKESEVPYLYIAAGGAAAVLFCGTCMYFAITGTLRRSNNEGEYEEEYEEYEEEGEEYEE